MIESPTTRTREVAKSLLLHMLETRDGIVVGELHEDLITQDEDGRWRVLFEVTIHGQKLIIRVDEPYRGETY